MKYLVYIIIFFQFKNTLYSQIPNEGTFIFENDEVNECKRMLLAFLILIAWSKSIFTQIACRDWAMSTMAVLIFAQIVLIHKKQMAQCALMWWLFISALQITSRQPHHPQLH